MLAYLLVFGICEYTYVKQLAPGDSFGFLLYDTKYTIILDNLPVNLFGNNYSEWRGSIQKIHSKSNCLRNGRVLGEEESIVAISTCWNGEEGPFLHGMVQTPGIRIHLTPCPKGKNSSRHCVSIQNISVSRKISTRPKRLLRSSKSFTVTMFVVNDATRYNQLGDCIGFYKLGQESEKLSLLPPQLKYKNT